EADRGGRRGRGDRAGPRARARRARPLARRRLPGILGADRGGAGGARGDGRTPMTIATAVAGTNIALVKYWGKRDEALNLPATGSLSLTLDRLGTRTRVAFDGGDGANDRVPLDGAAAPPQVSARVSAFLDRVRARAGIDAPATVVTDNS